MPQIADPRAIDYRAGATAPQDDIPLWLRAVNLLTGQQPSYIAQTTPEAKMKAKSYEIQKGLQQYVSNLQHTYSPETLAELPQQAVKYVEDFSKFSSDVPLWQRVISGGAPLPEAFKVMGDVGRGIEEAFAQTPYFGATNVKPYDMPLEEWEKKTTLAQTNIPNPLNPKENLRIGGEAAGFLTPDMFLGGGPVMKVGGKAGYTAEKIAARLVKTENPIYEITKLLKEGANRQTIYEAMTTKAKGARQWATNEAQDLLRTAEDEIAKIKGVGFDTIKEAVKGGENVVDAATEAMRKGASREGILETLTETYAGRSKFGKEKAEAIVNIAER